MNRTDELRPVALPIRMLRSFPNHPYKVSDDDAMFALMDSVDAYGVLSPVLVRRAETGYEIISGHRRCHAARAVGLNYVPAIVCDLSRDEAAILLVDSNLHREHLLPSEKAFAYKMKLDALKHQGKAPTSCQDGAKLRSDEQVAQDAGESARTVQRYGPGRRGERPHRPTLYPPDPPGPGAVGVHGPGRDGFVGGGGAVVPGR